MNERDDCEHRLGRGLKRWAESGTPTVDLEAYVKSRTPEPAKQRPRRWSRWATGFSVAAGLALALTVTFPSWAGAAASLPVIGPALTEIILKDAGLTWAYQTGLIEGTLAQASDGELNVRVIGAVADSRRTTVIYQITGLPAHVPDLKPAPAGAGPGRPHWPYPDISLTDDSQSGRGSWSNTPVETPLGLIGTVSTLPLETESTRLVVSVRLGVRQVQLPVQVSRTAADKVSREVVVNQSQEIDGVRFTVESVVYTPVETIVRYREEKPSLSFGGWRYDRDTEQPYLEMGGRRYSMSGGNDAVFNGVHIDAFPPLRGPITFVVPVAMKGVEADMVWPLKPGATQQAGNVAIKLTKWAHTSDQVSFAWAYPPTDQIVGFGTFEAVDESGNTYPLGRHSSAEGNNLRAGTMVREIDTDLPADFTPVAVRARVVGHKVIGPWRFELPQ